MVPTDRLSGLRGASRLAVDATIGLTDLVETVHASVTRPPATGAAADAWHHPASSTATSGR